MFDLMLTARVSTKAVIGDHDENISFGRTVEIMGADIADQLRALSLKIYIAAAEYAATRGRSFSR